MATELVEQQSPKVVTAAEIKIEKAMRDVALAEANLVHITATALQTAKDRAKLVRREYNSLKKQLIDLTAPQITDDVVPYPDRTPCDKLESKLRLLHTSVALAIMAGTCTPQHCDELASLREASIRTQQEYDKEKANYDDSRSKYIEKCTQLISELAAAIAELKPRVNAAYEACMCLATAGDIQDLADELISNASSKVHYAHTELCDAYLAAHSK